MTDKKQEYSSLVDHIVSLVNALTGPDQFSLANHLAKKFDCYLFRNEETDIHLGDTYHVEYDRFIGEVIGYYLTRENQKGVVLQQIGTKVVHVYHTRHLRKDKPDGQ